jgi:hypothetical protein
MGLPYDGRIDWLSLKVLSLLDLSKEKWDEFINRDDGEAFHLLQAYLDQGKLNESLFFYAPSVYESFEVEPEVPNKYKYFRFSPTTNRGGLCVQLNGFSFSNETGKLAPKEVIVPGLEQAPAEGEEQAGGSCGADEDPSKLLDGDAATFFVNREGRPIIFHFEEAVTPNSYEFTTAADATSWQPFRDPTSWVVEGCNDLEAGVWAELHKMEGHTEQGEEPAPAKFPLEGVAEAYRYLRFTPLESRGQRAVSLAEFSILTAQGAASGAKFSSSGKASSGSEPDNLGQEGTSKVWLDTAGASVVLEFKDQVHAEKYRMRIAGDPSDQDPIGWRLEATFGHVPLIRETRSEARCGA